MRQPQGIRDRRRPGANTKNGAQADNSDNQTHADLSCETGKAVGTSGLYRLKRIGIAEGYKLMPERLKSPNLPN
jgi:hypothetical protein